MRGWVVNGSEILGGEWNRGLTRISGFLAKVDVKTIA